MTAESMNKAQRTAFASWQRKGYKIERFNGKAGVIVARLERDEYGNQTHRKSKKLIAWNGDVTNLY